MQRTLLVGLDAACWDYLDPLLKTGRLPTIQKLIHAGISGVLRSTMPAITPAAWSSLATGKNPGKHGVFDMLWHKPGGYSFMPTYANVRHGTPFWQYLNKAGIRVGLINVPFTHPPTPVNGFVVCGFGTPGSARDLIWPPEALDWAESRFGRYEPVVSPELLQNGTPEEILAAEKKHQAQLIEIGLGMTERYPVDVLAINLMLTDHANHKMPRIELVQEAYIQSDADIETLLKTFQPDNVLLISDHGSSRLTGDFLLNMWLRERGYCVYQENTAAQQDGALDWILRQWLRDHLGWSGRSEKVLRRLIRVVLPRLPKALQRRFWDQVENVIPFAESHMRLSTKPDFNRTAIFPGSLYSGVLYFNVFNREPNGIVPAEEKKALASKLKAELSQIKEPNTGKRLFTNVFSSDELYGGAAAGDAPDLIVDAYGSQWNIRTRQPAPFKGKRHDQYFVTFDQKQDYGWHGPDGIFVFAGPAFRSGQASGGGVMDIPATLLHMYDVPLPTDWDGRVLLELLMPEWSERPIREQPGDAEERNAVAENALSKEEADSLVSHLRALGYL